jgi:hypothetical protein
VPAQSYSTSALPPPLPPPLKSPSPHPLKDLSRSLLGASLEVAAVLSLHARDPKHHGDQTTHSPVYL